MHFNMIYIPNTISELGDFHENKPFKSYLQIFTSSGKTLKINFGIILFLFYVEAEFLKVDYTPSNTAWKSPRITWKN